MTNLNEEELNRIGKKLIRQEEALRHAREIAERYLTGQPAIIQRWATEICRAIDVGLNEGEV